MSQYIFPPFPGSHRSVDWIGGNFPGFAPTGSERAGGSTIGYPFLVGPGTYYPLPSIPLAQAFRYWIAPGAWKIVLSGTYTTPNPPMGWYSPPGDDDPAVPYLNNGSIAITKAVQYGTGFRQTNVSGTFTNVGAYSDAQARGDGALPRNWLSGAGDIYVTAPLNLRMGISNNLRTPNPSGRSINGLFTDYNDTGFLLQGQLGPGGYSHFLTGGYCYIQILGTGPSGLGQGLMFDTTRTDLPCVFMPVFIDVGGYGISYRPLIPDPAGGSGPYSMIPDPNYVENQQFSCTLDSMPIKMYINWQTGPPNYGPPVGTSAQGSLAITTINAIDVMGNVSS